MRSFTKQVIPNSRLTTARRRGTVIAPLPLPAHSYLPLYRPEMNSKKKFVAPTLQEEASLAALTLGVAPVLSGQGTL